MKLQTKQSIALKDTTLLFQALVMANSIAQSSVTIVHAMHVMHGRGRPMENMD